MNITERMMVALASATYDGSSISWQLGLDGEPNRCFRIRWESANAEEMIVRGYAESFGDDVPPAVIGRIDVEANVSDRDGSVIMGDLRIMSHRPEWFAAPGSAIVLGSLGTPVSDESIWGDTFGEVEA